MIDPAFEILNQRGTPMFFSDTFANRPTAGIIGRIFISTDTAAIYRDTGTGWDLISDAGAGSSNLQQVTNNGSTTTLAITTGGLTATNLAGGGSQMVVVNNAGTFGVQAIPTDTNIYNSNGTLTGNRLVSLNSNYLSFAGGQTYIGSQTASSGLLTINNANSDAHLQVVGANSPSIRIDNAGTGATQRFVMGLATATNNFIQGSTAGDVCISTASASPLLFGMWQTINASEVMRITTSNNISIGYNVDLGYKLYVNGAIGTNGSITIGNGGTGTSYLYALSGSDLILNAGGDRVTIRQTGNVIINNLAGSGTRMVVADASGVLSTQAIGSGSITGSGTTNYVPKFTGSSAIGNSVIQEISGNICIGSSSPGSTSASISLSIGVPATTSGGLQLWAPTNQTHYVQFGDGTTGGDPYRGYVGYTQTNDALLFGTSSTERGRFSNVGNLLIGTQTDSGYLLDVNGTGIFRGQLTASTTNGSTSAIFQNTGAQNSNGIELRGGTAGTAVNWKIQKDGTISNALEITPSTSAGGTTYTTPIVTIDNTGLFGLGTYSGNGKLNIIGTSSDQIRVGTASTEHYRIGRNASTGYLDFYGSQTGYVGYKWGGVDGDRMSINTNGYLIIGTVYAPNKYLNVQDSAYFSDLKRQYALVGMVNDNAVISTDWYSGAGGTTPPIAFMTSQVERMRISPSTGNVLIGTSTDSGYKLDVNGVIRSQSGLYFTNGGTNGAFVWNIANEALRFGTNDIERARITPAGNFLIGTSTNSGEKLYLNGSLRIDGQTSGTAGGSSGQHLIINCDGTTYKIALLNN